MPDFDLRQERRGQLDWPDEGVFSLHDDDGQWLSLRDDLTAPLARYVAENYQNLPKPFRR